MKSIGTKKLETERLILRRFEPEDAVMMYKNWASDPEVTKTLTWPTHQSVEDSRQILEEWIQQYDNDEFYEWAITLKEDQQVIGSIGVVSQRPEVEMVHIGYCLSRKYWNRGLMSEALERLIAFFFDEVGVNRIESRHAVDNPGSGKVMEKCGLIKEGCTRQSDRDNRGISDSNHYAILREDRVRDMESI